MKNILIPCDFSQPAIHAFRVAVDIAGRSHGKIHLIHVVELPVLHDTVLMPVLSFEEAMLKEMTEKADEQFKKLTAKYAAGVEVSPAVVYGAMAAMILEYIREHAIDLVVMGTHGASGLKEVLIGSNTEKIVRHSPVPVLAIRSYVNIESVKNIVFPNALDTENQESLVGRVKALQHFFNATLHILWVNTPINFTRDTTTYKRLHAFTKRFMLTNSTVNVFNDPYEESGIIEFAHFIKADMIAMGTRGRKGLAHLLTGSVAEDVVNHMDLPIWTCTVRQEE
jgi:nucleotide-binding universal stress UspA family protein